MSETKMTIRLPDDLKEKLKALAEKEGRSLHNMMITILREKFEKE